MSLLYTLLAFVVALGSLIIIHELGHYSVARLCGVKVLRFSVGMGHVLYSRRFGRDQTEWALSILPLGGYVKMLDAREQDISGMAPEDLAREFTRQSVWRRIAIVAAGPFANFVLAIVLFAALFMHGMPELAPNLGDVPIQSVAGKAGLLGDVRVTAVNGEAVTTWSDVRWKLMQLVLAKKSAQLSVERANGPGADGGKIVETVTVPTDSLSANDLEGDFLEKLGLNLAYPPAVLGKILDGPAQRAGLREGDRILDVNGVPIKDGLALIKQIRAMPGKTLIVHGVREGVDGKVFTAQVTPEVLTEKGRVIGRIRAEVPLAPEMIVVSDTPLAALLKGVGRTWDTSVMTVKMIGKMLIGQVSWKNVTGPITIAEYAGEQARVGVISYLGFIAFISISLGVMNLLPIPVLDGGHLMYYLLEILTGRPVSARFGEIAQRAGIGILMTLMIVAVFNDIARLRL